MDAIHAFLEKFTEDTEWIQLGNEDTILLVDDTPANLGVLVEAFQCNHLNVSIAKNGEKALELAKSLKPSLILLDVLIAGP